MSKVCSFRWRTFIFAFRFQRSSISSLYLLCTLCVDANIQTSFTLLSLS